VSGEALPHGHVGERLNESIRAIGRTDARDVLALCRLEDYVTEENPVRVIDVFVEQLDLDGLGFAGMQPEATGRPAYHPSTMLKIYLYG
jgi:transposase